MSYCTTVRGPNILRDEIVSGYVTFYQVNKLFGNIYFFIINKITSGAGFGPRAVVWRLLLY